MAIAGFVSIYDEKLRNYSNNGKEINSSKERGTEKDYSKNIETIDI